MESQRELYTLLRIKPDAVIPLEIGGGNGLQGLIIGASSNMNIAAVDGDWMGRAYPVSWQTTPVVYEKKAMMVPTCISDGNGRVIVSCDSTQDSEQTYTDTKTTVHDKSTH